MNKPFSLPPWNAILQNDPLSWTRRAAQMKNCESESRIFSDFTTMLADFWNDQRQALRGAGSHRLAQQEAAAALAELEQQYILRILADEDGNKTRAAKILGVFLLAMLPRARGTIGRELQLMTTGAALARFPRNARNL